MVGCQRRVSQSIIGVTKEEGLEHLLQVTKVKYLATC